MNDIDKRLAEIEARANAATPGKWFHCMTELGGWTIQIATGWLFKHSDKGTRADAVFIAHARDDIPWLIEQLRDAAPSTGETRP